MADLLVELFSEEIPARMQAPMAANLENAVKARLEKDQLQYARLSTYTTPRRLVLRLDGLPLAQNDVVIERRGPRVDAPQKAVEGFLRANNLSLTQVSKRAMDKGEFYFAEITQKGQDTAQVLSLALAEIIASLTWPKSMRWGANEMRWVRPLKNILALFDGRILPFSFGHVHSNQNSFGHRFLAPDPFSVTNFATYQTELEQRHVILDAAERQKIISTRAAALAADHGLELLQDPNLLTEVAGLVEWPVVLMGRIDESYMDVPEEALVSSIRTHQKYFCLRRPDGPLAAYFLVVSNMATGDEGVGIVAGNERVLRARLADAAFFWNQDRKRPLADRVDHLEQMIFHARLGTVAAKVGRLQKIARFLAPFISADPNLAARTALLCKADLVTEMVGEFPDLQGVMGSYYALDAGEDAAVAEAIKDHYSPLGPNDFCPTAPLSIAVSLADKMDTLVGLFAINEKPTGSKDPFALRRAALGVIRVLLENKLSVPLRPWLEHVLAQYPDTLFSAPDEATPENDKKSRKAPKATTPQQAIDDLLNFFGDRLKSSLREQNVRHDLISAVFDGGDQDDLLRVIQRVEALEKLLATEDGDNLLSAYRRATNIVRIEEKKDRITYEGAPVADLFEAEAEKELFQSLQALKDKIPAALENYRYAEAMSLLAGLRGPIDAFFETVIVNSEQADQRRNRLLLLAQMRTLINAIANFDLIEKKEG